MAVKKPLVLQDGMLGQLASVDTIEVPTPSSALEAANKAYVDANAGAGGGLTISSKVINFGINPVRSKAFNIAFAGCVVGQDVLVTQNAATGTPDMDAIKLDGFVLADGIVRVFAHSITGRVKGPFNIKIWIK
jgi:hypothetical protein